MRRYNPKEIEPKWQQVWEQTGIYKVENESAKDNYYCLAMFPYPSGNIHVGHWYNFGPADTVARYHRMTGKNVLHPMGFDAFGLPAENAAIKNNTPPDDWTTANVSTMRQQLKKLGTMYDWEREVNTSKPDYYRWTQWIFLKLYENGLAYKKKAAVNWCPKDQTVLANEQVVGDNNECERCGTAVEQKDLEQWYFKITDYAEELLDSTEKLDWPQRVKTMQENWIGRSVGAEVDFSVEGLEEIIRVFTTRPDTLFGATYMVLAPEHPLVDKLVTQEQRVEVEQYAAATAKKTELDRKEAEKDKTGVFTGGYAVNPVNNQKIPIWVSDYVLMSYGTGAIMAVPAHDQRDWEFATKYELPIVEVVKTDQDVSLAATPGEGRMINSAQYDGLEAFTARDKIVEDLQSQDKATQTTNYKLRDWLISRQRYWGPPIPMIKCDDCGDVAVPYEQLPVELPRDVHFEPTGQSPLQLDDNFVNTTCPECAKPAKRETDTLDTFVDSSWYYLRYPNNTYIDGPFDPAAVEKWLPVDHYIGGIEHAILHLLYSRFITKALRDHSGLKFDEPFKRLTNQGMILGPDGLKMSKSKGNVVDPDDQVGSYGADSLRLYLMFMGPYNQGGAYDFGGIAGTRRFIDRVWHIAMSVIEGDKNDDLDSTTSTEIAVLLSKTIKKVTQDIERNSFNTAIASMMELVNKLNKIAERHAFSSAELWRDAVSTLSLLLAPFAPHLAEELWEELGNTTSIHLESWPLWDEKMLETDGVTVVVQVNGKLRANIQLSKGASDTEMEAAARQEDNVIRHIENGEVIKTITVSDKLINFVVKL